MHSLQRGLLSFISPWICALVVFGGCGKKPLGADYQIALDPSWYSLDAPGRDSAITAFSFELLDAICAKENLKIVFRRKSWSNLLLGLQEKQYDAILGPMRPYLFYEKIYGFSDIYLGTGPVFVIAANASWKALSARQAITVGILDRSVNEIILDRYPNASRKAYNTIQRGLDDVKSGVIDAMILDVLTAQAFVTDLYRELKIGSSLLIPEGLRLITLRGDAEKLIHKFNQGLADLKVHGTYQKLAEKWGLPVLVELQ